MKTHTKAKSTRIMEIILGLFIVAFIIRAIPNVDVIPNIPWAEDQTNGDLGNTDDKVWANYARMEFMATHPPAAEARTPKIVPVWKSPKIFPVLPG